MLAVYKGLGRPVPAESESAATLTLENGSRVVSLPGTEGTVRSYSAVRLLLVDEARTDQEGGRGGSDAARATAAVGAAARARRLRAIGVAAKAGLLNRTRP